MKSIFLIISVFSFAIFIIIMPASISSAQDESADSRMQEEQRQLKYEDVVTLRKTEKEPLAKKNFVFAYCGWETFANTKNVNILAIKSKHLMQSLLALAILIASPLVQGGGG